MSRVNAWILQKKTYAVALAFSRNGEKIALLCADGMLRVFRMGTGKLTRCYDESLEVSIYIIF